MLGRVLTLYYIKRFFATITIIFIGCMALIFLIDFVETLRKVSKVNDDVGFAPIMLLTLFKLPSLSEQILPFAVLFGSISAFLSFNRASELTVGRAAGLSVWQLMLPGLVVATVIGAVAVTLYNPLSAHLTELQSRFEAEYLGRGGKRIFSASGGEIWLHQDGHDGRSVIQAQNVRNEGQILDQVTVFLFGHEKKFVERIEARIGYLRAGHWHFRDAWVISPDVEPVFYNSYVLSTYLNATQVREGLGDAEEVSFWNLPGFIARAERAGLPATGFRLHYHGLLAKPVLMWAMVIIAACVSLRPFRFGNIAAMVVAGIGAGLLLYLMSKILTDLSANDLFSPILASWLPPVIGIVAGLSFLLYQEDG